MLAGAGIAALDLGVIGGRRRHLRALPLVPQLMDHLAFGIVVAHVIMRRRSNRKAEPRGWLPTQTN
jgi:hypothetical protein